jgi:cation:H+ antiporter
LLSVFIVIFSIGLIVGGANLLVDGAISVSARLRIPPVIIGLTVVSIGTSLPELAISGYAAYAGHPEIAVGNIVGSNIANVLLIFGFVTLISPITILKSTLWRELPFTFMISLVLIFMINDRWTDADAENLISTWDGIILLSMMCIFLVYLYYSATSMGSSQENLKEEAAFRTGAMLVLGVLALVGGGRLFVDSLVDVAIQLGVSKAVAGLTIAAVGTSMPELVTSLVAAVRKHHDIAAGNIVGSNIFNILLILGVSSVIAPLPKGDISDLDLWVSIFSAVLMFVAALFHKNYTVGRWAGLFFLIMYVMYIGRLLQLY